MVRIAGFVTLPGPLEAPAQARLHVYLERVAAADAPAERLGAVSLESLSPRELRAGWLPFELEAPETGQAGEADCALRAHVDLDGDGAIGPGDYVTTRHVPLPRPGAAGLLLVPVERLPQR